MMRGAGGAVVVAVAAMLVCCSADHHQNQDANTEHFDASGHKTRNLDPLGGGHLIRDVGGTYPYLPYLLAKQSSAYRSGGESGHNEHKRNFDEIDRSDLSPMVGKRNFDEIDLSSMPFPNGIKRFYSVYGGNYLDWPIEAWHSGINKKRLRPDFPMDEIDLSHFPIGSKRAPPSSFYTNLRQMDPIDITSIPIGSKRSLGTKLNYFDRLDRETKKRVADFPMDEIDASYFPVGSRRSVPLRR